MALSLRDAAAFRATFGKLMARLDQMMPKREGRRRGVSLERRKVGEYDLWFLNVVGDEMPLAPAWTVTDSHLVFGLFPQGVRACATRGVDQATSFAARAAKLARADATSVAYTDAADLARTLYPLLLPVAQLALGEVQREGFALDVADLPGLGVIVPHLGAEVVQLRHVDGDIELSRQGTLPLADPILTFALPVMAGSMWTRMSMQRMMAIRQQELMRAVEKAQQQVQEDEKQSEAKRKKEDGR
jgi:hypothetical protein